jgi:hypothetical protein
MDRVYLCSLLGAIMTYFRCGDNGGAALLCNLHSVPQMVVVAMGDKDKIGPQPLGRMNSERISLEPWIDEDTRFSILQPKTGMAIISNLHPLLLSG